MYSYFEETGLAVYRQVSEFLFSFHTDPFVSTSRRSCEMFTSSLALQDECHIIKTGRRCLKWTIGSRIAPLENHLINGSELERVIIAIRGQY